MTCTVASKGPQPSYAPHIKGWYSDQLGLKIFTAESREEAIVRIMEYCIGQLREVKLEKDQLFIYRDSVEDWCAMTLIDVEIY